jgi:hypothetical protein
MPGILAKMKKLEVKQKPFANEVDYRGIVHWDKPQLVAILNLPALQEAAAFASPLFSRASGKISLPAK